MGLGSKAYPVLTGRLSTPVSALPVARPGEGGDAASANVPATLAALCAWYAAGSAEIAAEGAALADSLVEVGLLCGTHYAGFEALCHALMVGDRKASKGQDLWIEELHYRRASRAALCVKSRYLSAMASLFDRYRHLEQTRSEVLAGVALLGRRLARASMHWPLPSAVQTLPRSTRQRSAACLSA